MTQKSIMLLLWSNFVSDNLGKKIYYIKSILGSSGKGGGKEQLPAHGGDPNPKILFSVLNL